MKYTVLVLTLMSGMVAAQTLHFEPLKKTLPTEAHLHGGGALSAGDLSDDGDTLSGSYYDVNPATGIEIHIDRAHRLTTNAIYRYGHLQGRPLFSHRLKWDSNVHALTTSGYFRVWWTASGSHWHCDYRATLYLDHYNFGQSLDVRQIRPRMLLLPTFMGTCPVSGVMEEHFSFDKKAENP